MQSVLQNNVYALDDPCEVMGEYKKNGDRELRNKLVMHYAPYINMAIYSMRSLLLSNIPAEDFFNQGVLTLIDCIDRFDPDRGVMFDTYIYKALRGALINYVRKQNWLPNRVWTAQKELKSLRKQLESELMREPTDQELAQAMGMSFEQYEKVQLEIAAASSVSYEELLEQSCESIAQNQELESHSEVDSRLLQQEQIHALTEAINRLPIRQKQVISLCYYEGMNLREIGEILGLTQQRVSQIRAKALKSLCDSMKKYEGI